MISRIFRVKVDLESCAFLFALEIWIYFYEPLVRGSWTYLSFSAILRPIPSCLRVLMTLGRISHIFMMKVDSLLRLILVLLVYVHFWRNFPHFPDEGGLGS